jgi:hypothetical protein
VLILAALILLLLTQLLLILLSNLSKLKRFEAVSLKESYSFFCAFS